MDNSSQNQSDPATSDLSKSNDSLATSSFSQSNDELTDSLSVPVSGDIRKKHRRATLYIVLAISLTLFLLFAILIALKLFA